MRSRRHPLDVVLVYPVTATLHATQHDLLASPDGKRPTVLTGTDTPAIQQVEAPPDVLGYVQVAAVPTHEPIGSSPTPSGGGSDTVATVLFAIAGVVLLLGRADPAEPPVVSLGRPRLTRRRPRAAGTGSPRPR